MKCKISECDRLVWTKDDGRPAKGRDSLEGGFCHPHALAARNLNTRFGMSLEEYLFLYEMQGGKCDICGEPGEAIGFGTHSMRALHTDHNHKTGMVRGLLCGPCNRAIGFFREDQQRMLAAVKYLSEDRAVPVQRRAKPHRSVAARTKKVGA